MLRFMLIWFLIVCLRLNVYVVDRVEKFFMLVGLLMLRVLIFCCVFLYVVRVMVSWWWWVMGLIGLILRFLYGS